ncbi:MAG TPA: BON domain-containing protein [Bryobacteraceae bacterium]|nr:BON domain-containing protein [Bryobacteraceae bacterium]
MKSRRFGLVPVAVLLLTGTALANVKGPSAPAGDEEIAARVSHEVATYPWYSLWDMVSVKVDHGAVTVSGVVTMPSKKDDIDRIVKRTPGISGVEDRIQVLPPSSTDDALRRQLARAIYGDPALAELAALTPPPIHILVENGHVTLAGVVENELQKRVAVVRASSVGMTFGPVVDNLVVENPPAKKKA